LAQIPLEIMQSLPRNLQSEALNWAMEQGWMGATEDPVVRRLQNTLSVLPGVRLAIQDLDGIESKEARQRSKKLFFLEKEEALPRFLQ